MIFSVFAAAKHVRIERMDTTNERIHFMIHKTIKSRERERAIWVRHVKNEHSASPLELSSIALIALRFGHDGIRVFGHARA